MRRFGQLPKLFEKALYIDSGIRFQCKYYARSLKLCKSSGIRQRSEELLTEREQFGLKFRKLKIQYHPNT